MRRILVVDDEPAVVDVVEFALKKAGFHVSVAGTLDRAREATAQAGADLVVLDLGLPDGDGMQLCRELREHRRTPVIVLTCRDDEADRVIGLESGADDYVVKPFSPRELVARVRSVLRRADESASEDVPRTLAFGRVRLDPVQHRVWLDECEVPLSRTEFDLLHALLRSPGRVFERDELIARVYAGDVCVSGRTVDSHVKGVRQAFRSIEPEADPIETVYGVGYRARNLR